MAEHADGLICVMELMLKGSSTTHNQMQCIRVADTLYDSIVTLIKNSSKH